MEYIALGGIHEHGRNCFLIQNEKYRILLDCGRGEKNECPDFSFVDVRKIDYLFLSHSHLDHTGAVDELLRRGFHGTLLCSKETEHLLKRKIDDVIYLTPNVPLQLKEDLHIIPRRSGHCFGSLSLEIHLSDKTILYTGDYLEESVFAVDKLRGIKVDLAIVDSAYKEENSYEENRKSFLSRIKEIPSEIILPLPKNGRNMDIISFLNEEEIPYRMENADFFIEEKEVYLKKDIEIKETKDARILLIQDPQLDDRLSREIVNKAKEAAILFTGTIDEGSYSDFLMKNRKNVFFSRVNVHQSKKEADILVSRNHFQNVVYFHSRDIESKKQILF